MPELSELEARTYKALRLREAAYEREVQKVLRDALNNIRVRMTIIYERHSVDGKLSLANMTQYNRLTTLEGQILGELDAATRANLRQISRLRPDQYGESFFRYAWSVDQSTGLRLRWGQLNRAAIIESLNNRDYKLAIQTYTPDARIKILRGLNNGLAQGKSYTQMSTDIKGAINATYNQAIRIIRTEGQTAVNAAQDAAYTVAEEQGVIMTKRWNATLDYDTREQHRAMDGQSKHEDGLYHMPNGETTPYPTWFGLSGGNRIRCRCSESATIEGYEPSLRRTREGGVVPYQTYPDWKKKHATWK